MAIIPDPLGSGDASLEEAALGVTEQIVRATEAFLGDDASELAISTFLMGGGLGAFWSEHTPNVLGRSYSSANSWVRINSAASSML